MYIPAEMHVYSELRDITHAPFEMRQKGIGLGVSSVHIPQHTTERKGRDLILCRCTLAYHRTSVKMIHALK